ncbi:anks1b, partial [Symbiodinium sp. CCMP2592]
MLTLKKMTGDGNCLFHALAHGSEENGVHLRALIIQYLEDNAASQENEEQVEAWYQEAEYLQSNASHWGGDTAIIAFTLMRQQRVILHWRTDDGHIQTSERTHTEVQDTAERFRHAGQDNAEIIHLWYNGRDHYDLLVPSQEQPPAPAPRAANQPQPTHDEASPPPPPPPPPPPHPEPRPPKRRKTAASRAQSKQQAPAQGAEETSEAAPAPPVEDGPTLLEELTSMPVAAKATHPRRKLEDALTRFANTHLRAQPLIPPEAKAENVDSGEAWPQVFCAFRGCTWSLPSGTEKRLHQHVKDAHAPELGLVAQHLPRPMPADALTSVYNEAIALRCREAAPVAGSSRDRSALRSFAEATSKDNVESLICFSCACIHPRVADTAASGRIDWHRLIQSPASNDGSHAESTESLHELLSMDRYLERY